MSDTRNALALLRDQRLDVLRRKVDRPESFILPVACARHDIDYNVTYERSSILSRFKCRKVEEAPPQSRLQRLRAGVGSKNGVRDIPVEKVDFAMLLCPGCRVLGMWTLCPNCHSFVCSALSRPGEFRCRKSCGTSFTPERMTSISIDLPGASIFKAIGKRSPPAIGHNKGLRSLPKWRK